MDKDRLKQLLAGLGIASLVAGVGLTTPDLAGAAGTG
jgi:radical SAM modification target selenobiotic family peptide